MALGTSNPARFGANFGLCHPGARLTQCQPSLNSGQGWTPIAPHCLTPKPPAWGWLLRRDALTNAGFC